MPHTPGPYTIGEWFEGNTADDVEACAPDAYERTDLSAQGFLPIKAGPRTIAWVVHDDNDPECEANAALFRAAAETAAERDRLRAALEAVAAPPWLNGIPHAPPNQGGTGTYLDSLRAYAKSALGHGRDPLPPRAPAIAAAPGLKATLSKLVEAMIDRDDEPTCRLCGHEAAEPANHADGCEVGEAMALLDRRQEAS